MKITQFSRPHPLCPSTPEILPLLDLGHLILNKLPSLKTSSKDGYYKLSTKFIIIKGWFCCLKSEWKRRFLVNNILMFGSAWCLVMAQIQFSLTKKIKDWTSRTLTIPHSLLQITSRFYLTPLFPKVDTICVSPLDFYLQMAKIKLIINRFIRNLPSCKLTKFILTSFPASGTIKHY